ncbi:MAG: arsenate reductase (glutaredoxin) [Planctomycetota bacterium]|nr:MAG: arsenate reductase (glutaredoxin) [Planctomycetota bacterium]
MTLRVWYNPRCSKCRSLKELLERRGFVAEYRHYLEQPPTRPELEDLLQRLGLDDPSPLVRRKEAAFAELELAQAGREELLEALVRRPELLERPILERGRRAVIARPPEAALPLLEGDRG